MATITTATVIHRNIFQYFLGGEKANYKFCDFADGGLRVGIKEIFWVRRREVVKARFSLGFCNKKILSKHANSELTDACRPSQKHHQMWQKAALFAKILPCCTIHLCKITILHNLRQTCFGQRCKKFQQHYCKTLSNWSVGVQNC